MTRQRAAEYAGILLLNSQRAFIRKPAIASERKLKEENIMHDHPKLYDKDGNEVTGRPEEGVTYYDADGNELCPPEKK